MTLQTTFDCPNPVALITGSGAPRVGRVIAMHLASLRCHVAIHANTSHGEADAVAKKISTGQESESIVVLGALHEEGVAEKIVEQTVQRFGRIDILVNSAAIWKPNKLELVSRDEISEYFQINSVGSFLCCKAAGLQMVEQRRGGSIVNIGDWATVRPYLDHAAYFPSKGAIEVMTRSLAVEFASRNPKIRVNCIEPGPVLLGDDVSDSKREMIAMSTLVNRVGSPENVAHAVQFLCENDFVTGVCLPVDGGRRVFAPDGLQVGMNTG